MAALYPWVRSPMSVHINMYPDLKWDREVSYTTLDGFRLTGTVTVFRPEEGWFKMAGCPVLLKDLREARTGCGQDLLQLAQRLGYRP